MAQITEANIREFIWKSIVSWFSLPRVIITDNGRQFDNQKFEDFYTQHHIQHRLTLVGHPQANGEAEITNRIILHGLKTCLNNAKGLWAKELNSVLWAYRTTPRTTTGESPFNLTYGSEAVLPVEITLQSFRIDHYDYQTNSKQRRTDLDLLEEIRQQANMKMVVFRQKMAKYYNSRVKARTFRVGDLVLRRAEVSRPIEKGKLSPNWEGPYQVTEFIRPGTYRLMDWEGHQLARPWNIENLRKYCQ